MGNLQYRMKNYFYGYYLGNDRELDIVSKESNRTILPLKTIYASLKELNVELFINELGRPRGIRGRPLTKGLQSSGGERSAKFVIEDMSRIYDVQASYPEGNYPLAPGSCEYPDEFISAWHKMISRKDLEEVHIPLLRFIEKSL